VSKKPTPGETLAKKQFHARFGMGLWISILATGFAFPGFWWLRDGVARLETAEDNNLRVGLFLVAVSVFMLWVALRGYHIAISVLLGRTSPRLAQRDFRNILSNIAMGAKTGMWKE
jgi:hypothetical protein